MTEEPIKRSTPQQRQAWNAFLKFVKDKGAQGSKELDIKDRARGLALLQEYNKLNPYMPVNEEFIPIAQQEISEISRGNFPGIDMDSGQILYQFLPDAIKKRTPSQQDSWFGSLTSQMGYPLFKEPEGQPTTEYERFIKSPAFSILKSVKRK